MASTCSVEGGTKAISGCEYGSASAGRANLGFVKGKVTSVHVYGTEDGGGRRTGRC